MPTIRIDKICPGLPDDAVGRTFEATWAVAPVMVEGFLVTVCTITKGRAVGPSFENNSHATTAHIFVPSDHCTELRKDSERWEIFHHGLPLHVTRDAVNGALTRILGDARTEYARHLASLELEWLLSSSDHGSSYRGPSQ
jgi:hypothetical protein